MLWQFICTFIHLVLFHYVINILVHPAFQSARCSQREKKRLATFYINREVVGASHLLVFPRWDLSFDLRRIADLSLHLSRGEEGRGFEFDIHSEKCSLMCLSRSTLFERLP